MMANSLVFSPMLSTSAASNNLKGLHFGPYHNVPWHTEEDGILVRCKKQVGCVERSRTEITNDGKTSEKSWSTYSTPAEQKAKPKATRSTRDSHIRYKRVPYKDKRSYKPLRRRKARHILIHFDVAFPVAANTRTTTARRRRACASVYGRGRRRSITGSTKQSDAKKRWLLTGLVGSIILVGMILGSYSGYFKTSPGGENGEESSVQERDSHLSVLTDTGQREQFSYSPHVARPTADPTGRCRGEYMSSSTVGPHSNQTRRGIPAESISSLWLLYPEPAPSVHGRRHSWPSESHKTGRLMQRAAEEPRHYDRDFYTSNESNGSNYLTAPNSPRTSNAGKDALLVSQTVSISS